MNGMTISEMAERLKLPRDTVRRRLLRAGRKPFSQEALYTEDDFEAIRNVPGKGRPAKKPEDPAKKG
jgi:predicted ArsR family transcriptional regulator